MMISPEGYYVAYLEGKTKEQIMSTIPRGGCVVRVSIINKANKRMVWKCDDAFLNCLLLDLA